MHFMIGYYICRSVCDYNKNLGIYIVNSFIANIDNCTVNTFPETPYPPCSNDFIHIARE